jgi:fatty acid desaturase
MYREILDDLYVDLLGEEATMRGWRTVKYLVKNRLLPETLLARWDKVVLAVWIYDNLQLLYGGFTSYPAILEEVVRLHSHTLYYSRATSVSAPLAIPIAAIPMVTIPMVTIPMVTIPMVTIPAVSVPPVVVVAGYGPPHAAPPEAANSLAPVEECCPPPMPT